MVYISKYIKKQDTIEAVQWTGLDSIKEVASLLESYTFTLEPDRGSGGFLLYIKTDSDAGPLVVNKNDYIILSEKSIYTVPAEKFSEDYEPYPSVYIKTEEWNGKYGSGSARAVTRSVIDNIIRPPQYTENN